MSGSGNNEIDRNQVVNRLQTLLQGRPEIMAALAHGFIIFAGIGIVFA